MMHRVRLLPAVALAVVLAVAPACSSDDEPSSSSGSAASSSLPSEEELAQYFGAVASYDVEQLRAAEPIAADGSAAEDYLHYQEAYASAAAAGGNPLPAAEAEPVDGGFAACLDAGEGEECATWADLEGEAGRLSGFSVNGLPIADNLLPLGNQPPISESGLFTAQPVFAYRSAPLQVLFVLVDVTAEDVPLEVRSRGAIYVEATTQLRGADSRGPTTIEAGETETVILAFPRAQDAQLDGEVTFEIRVGQEPLPVGFGLTAPGS